MTIFDITVSIRSFLDVSGGYQLCWDMEEQKVLELDLHGKKLKALRNLDKVSFLGLPCWLPVILKPIYSCSISGAWMPPAMT